MLARKQQQMPPVGPHGRYNDGDSALRHSGAQAAAWGWRRRNWGLGIAAEGSSTGVLKRGGQHSTLQCPKGHADLDSDLGPRACEEWGIPASGLGGGRECTGAVAPVSCSLSHWSRRGADVKIGGWRQLQITHRSNKGRGEAAHPEPL